MTYVEEKPDNITPSRDAFSFSKGVKSGGP